LNTGTRGKKCHNVARRQNYVKRFGDAARTQVELGEVAEEPARTGMVPLGRLDEHWVNVDTDHVVTDRSQISTQPSGATPGVEDAGSARRHRIDEACLADDILTGPRH
jgi:hypothetical protein